jgi:very-short-patch-repair endonuclease
VERGRSFKRIYYKYFHNLWPDASIYKKHIMGYTYYHGPRRIIKARNLRKEQTKAEKILWEKLRNRNICGFKFRRQQIIDEMIVDFFCPGKKLVVELDGPYHNDPLQRIKDTERDQELENLGFKVVRFTNDQIINDLDKVISQIIVLLNSPSPRPKGAGEGAGG